MSTFITVLIIIAAILLILLVLVQNSKGGGLASGFASGNQVMGAPKTADFLEKATWTLIGIIAFLSIIAVTFSKKNHKSNDDADETRQEEISDADETFNGEEATLPESTADFSEEAANQED